MILINQIVRHIFAYKTTFWVCQVTIIGDWKLPQLTFCHKCHTEGGYSEAFSVKKLFQSPNWILAYNPPWQCVRRQLATEKHIFYYSVKMYPCLQYFPIYWSVSNISQYIGLSVINPNLLGVLWNPQDLLLLMGIEISWIVSKIFQFIGLYPIYHIILDRFLMHSNVLDCLQIMDCL